MKGLTSFNSRNIDILSYLMNLGIAAGYGLDGRSSIPGRARDSSVLHSVETGSGAHPASYTMGTVGSFPWGKAAGA
jgi:hypothetical protein